MKRLILLLILFVNLQIVITHEDMKLFSYSTASAQHMTKEAGDNCQDPVDKLWYRFPFSDCEEVIVTPRWYTDRVSLLPRAIYRFRFFC